MSPTVLDHATCYRAVASKDRRFDGVFYTAVATTGIYCRPSCPARTPSASNVAFYPTAAAAQAAGFRACKRCIPDATPGSPDWDVSGATAGRAMRLIADGVVDREGVPGLAARVGYTPRHLTRVLTRELGAGPLALARARRAQTARILIDSTPLGLADVAFAAGFASVRQFNDTIREVYGLTPTELRGRRLRQIGDGSNLSQPGTIRLRLAVRTPFFGTGLLRFLGPRAIPGVEAVGDGWYARTLALPHAPGVIRLELPDLPEPGTTGTVVAELTLGDLRDISAAVERARRLLDADCDPVAVDAALAPDPLIGPLLRRWPGLRVPGHVDGAEVAVRALVGQQISVASARTVLARLVQRAGAPLWLRQAQPTFPEPRQAQPPLPEPRQAQPPLPEPRQAQPPLPEPRQTQPPLPEPVEGMLASLTHLFPTPEALASLTPDDFPMPKARARAIIGLGEALASGSLALDRGPDRDDTRRGLLALPGIGEWTADYIAIRALGHRDAFMPTDLGTKQALAGLGEDPRRASALAEAWRPWRSYAQSYLWQTLLDPEGAPHVDSH